MKKKYVLMIIILAVLGIAAVVFLASGGGAILSGSTDIDRTSGGGNDREIGQPVPYENPETEAETLQTEPEKIPADAYGDSGKILNIYTYSDSFQFLFNEFYLDHKSLPDGVDVKFTVASSLDYKQDLIIYNDGLYLLDDDEKIDIILLEPEFAAKFLDSDYVMTLHQLGISENELTDQFEFTKELTSDSRGVQMGLMCNIRPEVFIYRRSLALTVLGTDEPDEVAKFLIGDEYDKTAQKMKEHGYTMLGSYEEDFRLFTQNSDEQIVDGFDNLTLPASWEDWARHTKEYIDNGYALPAEKYSDEWHNGLNSSKVFGYIGDSNYAEFDVSDVLRNVGDFSACTLPVPTYAGGTIFCAAKETDNPELVADIMRTLTADPDVLKSIALRAGAVTNTVSGMTEIANGTFESNLFGGFNPYGAYVETAKNISGARRGFVPSNELYKLYIKHMRSYFEGECTFETAREAFLKDAVLEYYLDNDEIDYREFLTKGDFKAPDNAKFEELDAARQILLTRLEAKGIKDGSCIIDYQNKTLSVTFTNTVDMSQTETSVFVTELGNRAIITLREGSETHPQTGAPAGVTASNLILDGSHIKKAEANKINDPIHGETWIVALELDEEGTMIFAKATKNAMDNDTAISIWLDDILLSAPYVETVITDGKMQIFGNFDIDTAKDLADKINAGFLPFELELYKLHV
jgi:hypothetical protein